jgi:hypothetical protein
MNVKVTDRYTGEYGICTAETLAESNICYGMTAEEIQTWKDAQAALLDNDWYALPAMAEVLKVDIEAI